MGSNITPMSHINESYILSMHLKPIPNRPGGAPIAAVTSLPAGA